MSKLHQLSATLATLFRAFILHMFQSAPSTGTLKRLFSFVTYSPIRGLRVDHAERFWNIHSDWEFNKAVMFQYQSWLVNYLKIRRTLLIAKQEKTLSTILQAVFMLVVEKTATWQFKRKVIKDCLMGEQKAIDTWRMFYLEFFVEKKYHNMFYFPRWVVKTGEADKNRLGVLSYYLIADFFSWIRRATNETLTKIKDWLWDQWYLWLDEWVIAITIAVVIAGISIFGFINRDAIFGFFNPKPTPTPIVLLSPVITSPIPEPPTTSPEAAVTQMPETPSPPANPILLVNIDGTMFIKVGGIKYAEGELLGTLVSRVIHNDQSTTITVEIDGQRYQSTQADAYIMKYSREGGTQLLTSHGEVRPEGEVNYTGYLSVYGRGLLFDMMGTDEYYALLTDEDQYILDQYYLHWINGARGENKSGVYYNITPDDHPELPGTDYPAPWNLCQYMRYYWWFAPHVDLQGLCDAEVSSFAYPDGQYLTHYLEQSGLIRSNFSAHDRHAPLTSIMVGETVEKGVIYHEVAVFPNLPSNAVNYKPLTCENSPIPQVFVFPYEAEYAHIWEVRYPQIVGIGYRDNGWVYSRGQLGYGVYLALIDTDQIRDWPASDFSKLTEQLEYFQITGPIDCT